MSCMKVDLEKESVFLTKRPGRCRRVLFQRSTCAVSPVSLPCDSLARNTQKREDGLERSIPFTTDSLKLGAIPNP